jgi:hypothetical protein
MLRRLFFLFPDEPHAQRVVDKLIERGVPSHRFHAMAKSELETLPQATERQKNDAAFRVENFLWRTNFFIFLVALLFLVGTLAAGEYIWSMISLLVMFATFFAGNYFAVHVPDVHLSEFTDALSHGEILLMIDVPVKKVNEIESYVHHHYPEAAGGGTSWAVDGFNL